MKEYSSLPIEEILAILRTHGAILPQEIQGELCPELVTIAGGQLVEFLKRSQPLPDDCDKEKITTK